MLSTCGSAASLVEGVGSIDHTLRVVPKKGEELWKWEEAGPVVGRRSQTSHGWTGILSRERTWFKH